MGQERTLPAYDLFEQNWESYDELRADFEWEVPETFNAAEYVCDRWATDKNRVALFSEDADGNERTFTYWQLQRHADRLANYLRDQGVERGDRVGMILPQKPETVVAHVAIWKLGAVSVPMSTLYGPDALEYRLGDAGATACIVDETNLEAFAETVDALPDVETVLTVDDDGILESASDFWAAPEDYPGEFETVETDPEDDLLIIYTSGTTGKPKGVRHAHRVLLGHLPGFATTFCNLDLDDGDAFWTPSEWAWVVILAMVFPALYYGKSVLAYTDESKFDPDRAFYLLEKYGITNFFAPPTALRMMTRREEPGEAYRLDEVRLLTTAGEALGEGLVSELKDVFGDNVPISEVYGQTEANLLIGDCKTFYDSPPGAIGKAAPGHEVTIVQPDDPSETVEPGEIGEFAVRYEGDPVCFKEYWNKPAKTDEKVREGWLLTEDLGTLDEDGNFTFKSRKDDVIISAGYRIGPEEIEDSLAEHNAVSDAAVIGIPDETRGEIPKAFVVPAGTADDELKEDLKAYVKSNLAKYEYPREIEFVNELPKTSTGKIRRTDLREREGIED